MSNNSHVYKHGSLCIAEKLEVLAHEYDFRHAETLERGTAKWLAKYAVMDSPEPWVFHQKKDKQSDKLDFGLLDSFRCLMTGYHQYQHE